MRDTEILGWDVGGAHLKAVLLDGSGSVLQALQVSCPLWRGMDHLERAVLEVGQQIGAWPLRHALTMSGELVDLFENRSQGVMQLVRFMRNQFPDSVLNVYAGPQGLIEAGDVAQHCLQVASANWHASAAFMARQVTQALFADLGSTTCDLILLHGGLPAAFGCDDAERLRTDELVYTGVVRTPVMAVAQRVPLRGEWQSLAAEHFATMADVYRLTGELPATLDQAETADGGPRTREASARRLARMAGCDLATTDMAQWLSVARAVRTRQLNRLHAAVERVLSRGLLPETAPLIGAGTGCFLLRELARRAGLHYRDAAEWIPVAPQHAERTSACLPAYAVAWLMLEGL